MKKIGITGHTKGIGKAVAERYTNDGYEVHGYSRSNGYSLPDHNDRVLEDCSKNGIDLFFNNAYDDSTWGLGQTKLLWMFYMAWRNDPSKTIITTGSISTLKARTKAVIYTQQKAALENTHDAMAHDKKTKCRMILIQPDIVHTERIENFLAGHYLYGIDPEPLADLIFDTEQNRNLLVTSLIVRTDLSGYGKQY